jgi:ABC-2 type transport system ATP-binding protein
VPELAIETHGLTKRFRSQLAVDGLDLAVPRGAVFGFLGPNGSGKTTTIRMLLGLVAATAGDARLLGAEMPRHVDSVLPRVGALVEGPAFSPYLSGVANLRRFDAADRHAPRGTRAARVSDALDRVGLSHAAEKKVHAYSLGMKQRLGLANALLMRRELLVLDEPTNGLDPQGTREVRALIRSLADDGTTVFVSSHLLAEVEQVCSHVAVMSAGRLVAQGTLDEFRSGGETRVLVRTPDPARAREVLAGLGLVLDGDAGGVGAAGASGAGGIRSVTDAAGDALVAARLVAPNGPGSRPAPAAEGIVAALVAAGVRVRGFELERGSLEQRFVDLTGEGFDVVQ